MVQFQVFSGKESGAKHLIRRLPCVIGRAAKVGWRLEEPGVWEKHVQLSAQPGEGIVLTVLDGALATLNGQPCERAILRNGDVIELGAAKLQFWLAQPRQRSFRFREFLTWFGLALLTAGQVALIWLLRQ